MFCKNCGGQLKEDSAFCPWCGNKVENTSSFSANLNFDMPAMDGQAVKKKKMPIIPIAIGVVAIIIVICLICTIISHLFDRSKDAIKNIENIGDSEDVIDMIPEDALDDICQSYDIDEDDIMEEIDTEYIVEYYADIKINKIGNKKNLNADGFRDDLEDLADDYEVEIDNFDLNKITKYVRYRVDTEFDGEESTEYIYVYKYKGKWYIDWFSYFEGLEDYF